MSLATIDFTDPAIQADPYPIYRELRERAPVYRNGPTWLISRHDDIVTLLTDPRVSSARVDQTFAVLPPEVQAELAPLRHVLGSRMLLTDPPTHTRLRNLMTKAFSARMVNGKRARVEEICRELLDAVVEQGSMDVMEDLAVPLPGRVIADMLGVPGADQEQFSRWARDQVRVYDRAGTANDRIAVMRQGQASMLEMKAYLEAVIEERRHERRDDLVTMLVTVEEEGDRLSVDEMIVMINSLLTGGNNSTAHLIGNAILTLCRHPEELARLRRDPELIRTAIEEVLRFESPVQSTTRVARERIEIGGQTIAAGDGITVLFGAANRDEAVFPEPGRFDVARQPNRQLTFAHGPHFCLGAALARAEAQSAVGAVIRRCADLELVSDEVEWLPGFTFRGPKTLPVRFRAA
ncbi:MAG TPA: cytochrome P450 [Thermomicrobiaceae bacterium]|nr:cytochrome P450 [Thermomicrobiaceae bacterium]